MQFLHESDPPALQRTRRPQRDTCRRTEAADDVSAKLRYDERRLAKFSADNTQKPTARSTATAIAPRMRNRSPTDIRTEFGESKTG